MSRDGEEKRQNDKYDREKEMNFTAMNSDEEEKQPVFQDGVEKDINFEKNILEVVNPMGRYQFLIAFWGYIVEAPVGLCVMYFLFGGTNPGFQCVDDNMYLNITQNTSNFDLSLLEFDNVCSPNGTRCTHRIYNTQLYTSIVSQWDLVCERQIYTTYISTALMAGMFVGASVFGVLGDIIGRKKVTFPMLGCMMSIHIISASCNSWQLMLFFRFVTGIFAGGALVVNFTIPFELMNSRWRGICSVLTGFPLATCILVVLAYFIRDWRYLAITTGALGLPLLLTWSVIPESPRWLIQNDRFEEAEAVIRTIARINRRPNPEYTILPKLSAAYHSEASTKKKYTYLDLFRTRQLTIQTCVMCLYWFSAASSYYGLAMNVKELSGDRYINALILGLLEQAFNMSVIVSAMFFGRRRCGAGYLFSGAICLYLIIVTQVVPQSKAVTYIQSFLSLLGRAAISGAWCMAFVFTVELFPTLIRSTAYGGCSMAARIGGVAAPYIAYLYFIHPSITYVIFGTCALASGVATLLFVPETKGKPMPDLMPAKSSGFCGGCRQGEEEEEEEADLKVAT